MTETWRAARAKSPWLRYISKEFQGRGEWFLLLSCKHWSRVTFASRERRKDRRWPCGVCRRRKCR